MHLLEYILVETGWHDFVYLYGSRQSIQKCGMRSYYNMDECLYTVFSINLAQFWLVIKVKEQLVTIYLLHVADYSQEILNTSHHTVSQHDNQKLSKSDIFHIPMKSYDKRHYFFSSLVRILKRWHDTLLAHCYHSIYLISLDSAIICRARIRMHSIALAVSRVNILLFIHFHILSFYFILSKSKIPNWLDARYHNGNKWDSYNIQPSIE